jgi:hypothetical protein
MNEKTRNRRTQAEVVINEFIKAMQEIDAQIDSALAIAKHTKDEALKVEYGARALGGIYAKNAIQRRIDAIKNGGEV